MDVFQDYKPIRNKISLLSVEDALSVIWAYCQYLQLPDFKFPKEIEVNPEYLKLSVPRTWISEWDLELLAKEMILNGSVVASKGRTLRTWNVVRETINSIKGFESKICQSFGEPQDVLVELSRIAHRQFIWQSNAPNSASTIRYYKIFNRPAIDKICREKIGLSVWELYMCGTACMGLLLSHPAVGIPFKCDIRGLSVEMIDKFFSFTSKPLRELKAQLKDGQQYNENFAYAFNALRAFPLVQMSYQSRESYVCPLMTLLYWRFTGGLYYDFVGVPEFGNEFGEGFQNYVGEAIERACPDPLQRISEHEYVVGKLKKRTVDWIVADEQSALFLECKAKRLSWDAKAALSNLKPLEADIDSMASAVVQVYKTLTDHLANAYPRFPAKEGRKIFPAIVTLENWRMFGPIMMNKLTEAVTSKLNSAGLSPDIVEKMPYSVWAIEELEVGLQIMAANGIGSFMEGKLNNAEMRQWDWHGYMTKQYPKAFPAKKLFEADYDEMFSALYAAQRDAA
jgi:hypothetical protein